MAEIMSHNSTDEEPHTRRSSADEYTDIQHELAERLVTLRAEFQESVARYSVRIQGLLAQVGDILDEDPGQLSSSERLTRARALRRALDQLDNVELKPAKGRRRDLKAVERFATKITDTVADW